MQCIFSFTEKVNQGLSLSTRCGIPGSPERLAFLAPWFGCYSGLMIASLLLSSRIQVLGTSAMQSCEDAYRYAPGQPSAALGMQLYRQFSRVGEWGERVKSTAEAGCPTVSNKTGNRHLDRRKACSQTAMHTACYWVNFLTSYYIHRSNSGSDAPPGSLDLEGYVGPGITLVS
jgi:hypothetical protein